MDRDYISLLEWSIKLGCRLDTDGDEPVVQ